MPRLPLLLPLAAAAALACFAAACGDGAKVTPTTTPGQPSAASSRPTVDPTFGPTPDLRDNIESVVPAYGARVTQASTRSPDPGVPNGACVQVNFNGLGSGNGQWFRVAYDGVEVTTKLIWAIDSFDAPTRGRVCYAPAEGFTVGRHFIAISVQDPKSSQLKQVVSWGFEVTA